MMLPKSKFERLFDLYVAPFCIACTRGRKISKEALQRDLEMIEQFERELQEGRHGKRG